MRIRKIAGIAFITLILLSINIPWHVSAASGDGTTTGSISLVPTVECIGVIAGYSGDSNQNNSAVLQYRVSGGSWKTAPEMYVDKSDRQYRGSIFWLNPDTTYEVKVTFSDSNGISGTNPVSSSTTTRNDDPAIGSNALYVATNGNDSSGDGSINKPWRTIQKAAGVVNAGNTVYVRGGTYTLSSSISISRSGNAANYITFMPYSGETVNINGNNAVSNLVDISGNYIRWRGFNLSGDRYSNDAGTIRLIDAQYCIVEDNTITNPNSAGGIHLRNGAANNIIQGNTITCNTDASAGAIYWWRAGSANVIRDNTITSNNANTMWDGMGGGPEDDLNYMYNTDIYDNYISFSSSIPGGWDRDDGIQLEGGNVNVRIWGNTIKNSYVGIGVAPVLEGPCYYFRNIIDSPYGEMFKMGNNSYGRIYIYHNTYYTNLGADGLKQTNAGIGNIVSKNNIIYAGRYIYELVTIPSSGDVDFDYNSIYTTDSGRFVKIGGSSWGGTYTSFSAYTSALNKDVHSISTSDNKFVNAGSGNFQLQSNSPCIDKGITLTGFNDADSPWPYRGNAPDIGAYEYDSGAPTNNPPVAANDAYATNEDTTLNVAAPGVLNNDADADGDTLTASKVSNHSHGSVTLNSNGSFAYTPDSGYTGADSFTYRANDGQANSNTATVTINVDGGTNNAPVAANDAYATNENTTLNVAAQGVLSNDTDADGDTLTASKVSNPSHGSVTLNSNGSFAYIPDSGYTGTDSFTYRANDGQANSNTATVTINVDGGTNNAPVALNNTYSTDEDTALNVATPGVLGNDTDADGDPLTAIKVSNPSHGWVTLNSNGSFTYTPTTNYNGSDFFTYRANDGQANSNTATVTITINVVNDAPVAVNDVYATDQDTNLNVAAPGVLSNDTDADGDTLIASKVSNPSHGSVTLNSNGSFTYIPNSGYTGTDSFTYRARDGQANSNTVTVTINVDGSVNNAPVALNNTYSTNEDTALNVAAPGVLGNDTDADGDPLTAIKVSNPSHGTVTLNSNGSFTYTPTANYNGADSFTYRANDGQANSNTATVTININAVNDPPELNTIGDQTVTEGENLIFEVTATDPDGDYLFYSAYNLPVGSSFNRYTHVFSWIPTEDDIGSYSNIRFRVSDRRWTSDTEAISIAVTSTAVPPSGGDDGGNSGSGSSGGDSGGGGNGGGVGSGVTYLRNFITQEGKIITEVVAESPDQKARLFIPKNTIVKDSDGVNANSIYIKKSTELTGPYQDASCLGLYEIGPSGTTFTPSATLVFEYLAYMLPEGIPEDNLFIALWDLDTMEWVALDSIVNTASNTVLVSVEHLSIYALMAYTRPVSFEMADFILTPQEVCPGESITASILIINQGDYSGTCVLELKLDNEIIQTESIDINGRASATVAFFVTTDTPGEHQVSIGDWQGKFLVKSAIPPAAFTISDFKINPTSVIYGEPVNISVLVENTGGASGYYPVELKIDGVTSQTKEIDFNNGSRQIISFDTTIYSVGLHEARIGCLQGTFEIEPPLAPDVVETSGPPKLTSFSAAMNYDEAINKVVSARIFYHIDQPYDNIPDAELTLVVYHDGELLERVPLLTLSQLLFDGKTGLLHYIPSTGWETGEYSFHAELYEGGKLIQETPLEKVRITPEVITKKVSWWSLGAVISVASTLILLIIAIIIYRKREMLKYEKLK
jgi:VCBS repeat-containing protein